MRSEVLIWITVGIAMVVILGMVVMIGEMGDHHQNPPPYKPPIESYACNWDYSLNTTDHFGVYTYPGAGMKYVILTLKVINNASESITTNLYLWSFTLNHITYSPSGMTYIGNWVSYQTVDVQHGGTFTWQIVYEVPTEVSLSNPTIEYSAYIHPIMHFEPSLL